MPEPRAGVLLVPDMLRCTRLPPRPSDPRLRYLGTLPVRSRDCQREGFAQSQREVF